jgi:hypothetical protein
MLWVLSELQAEQEEYFGDLSNTWACFEEGINGLD